MAHTDESALHHEEFKIPVSLYPLGSYIGPALAVVSVVAVFINFGLAIAAYISGH